MGAVATLPGEYLSRWVPFWVSIARDRGNGWWQGISRCWQRVVYAFSVGSRVEKKSQERSFWIKWVCHGQRTKAEELESREHWKIEDYCHLEGYQTIVPTDGSFEGGSDDWSEEVIQRRRSRNCKARLLNESLKWTSTPSYDDKGHLDFMATVTEYSGCLDYCVEKDILRTR